MEKFQNICMAMKEAISPAEAWEADNRFNTALVSFDSAAAESILGTVVKTFENQFDTKSIKKASKQEKNLAKSLSGISKEQLLFTSNEGGLTLFGAWWPWGNNQKISLRIGLYTLDDEVMGEEKIKQHLKEWFAL